MKSELYSQIRAYIKHLKWVPLETERVIISVYYIIIIFISPILLSLQKFLHMRSQELIKRPYTIFNTA
jgi:hypothetical protein